MSFLSSRSETIGFIGAGNMAAALIRGFIRAGFPAEQILICDLDTEKTRALQEQWGVQVLPDAAALQKQAEVLFLAVKPAGILPLLSSLPQAPASRLWISLAPGISLARLGDALGAEARIIRSMPNTPALVGAGATALCPGAHTTSEDRALAEELFRAAGLTVTVEEKMMDAVTGLSGSGPAFVLLAIEALADGGVHAGLPRASALQLAAQTVLGTAQLVLETGQHPGALKDAVTSPGGTTIRGVEALENRGFRGALLSAVVAAAARSRELSQSE